jgi:cytochrome c oxidase subunit 1
MTDLSLVRTDLKLLRRITPARAVERFEAELRSWAILAASSLAIAGVFAFLLAMSRVPGMEKIVAWPIGFFSKGLVIHVVFSLIIWFLTIFALLASCASRDAARGDLRLAALGRAGLALVSMSFPLLFLPAFHAGTTATLNNYVPVIIHPAYYLGLAILGLGILLPVIRLFANTLPRITKLAAMPFATTMGGIVYCVAFISFVAGVIGVWGEEPSRQMHEHLFWGGGHVLQFLYCLLMLTGWYVLARLSLKTDVIDLDIFKIATGMIALFALPAILFYAVLEPFSALQTEAFRRLQFVLAFPSLLIACGAAAAVIRQRAKGLPWQDPAFVAIVLSALVFAVGGTMGLVINGTDTRTPAHYHGVIAGVNLACMGLMLRYCLPMLSRPPPANARLKLQIALFGFGQLLASIGLFLAGGYGAPRKTPSGAVNLADGAVIGMTLHGIGALFAVLGGTLFVITVLRSLLKPVQAHSAHSSEPTRVTA